MEQNYSESKVEKKIKWFWITFGILIFSIIIFFLLILKGWIGYMPSMQDLENPINKYATQVISADMQIMGMYAQSEENRIYVDYKKLSPAIIQALIVTEDSRFIKHSGIDFYALLRSIVKRGILFQKNSGGGSTISQQLAKQLYSKHAKSFLERLYQKPIEWMIAIQLERFYTKEEIINMYLNKFDFLYNAVGIQTACYVYFGKLPQNISIEEAATLIGMCKNPSYFNPLRHVQKTQRRRNVVLNLMRKNGYISREECDSLMALPLVTDFHRIDHKEGIAPYFREHLRLLMTAKKPDRKDYNPDNTYKYVEDSIAWETNPLYGWCNKNKKSDGSSYDLYTDGLKIYTTLDSRMQIYAEQAVSEHIGDFLQPAFFKEKKSSSTAPYSHLLSRGMINAILERSMKQTSRYWMLTKENMSEKEIKTIFNTPIEMQVFSWQGMRDTVMSLMDSIRYMKSFLRTGFMAMDTHSGAVKAYVGGIDYKYFQYNMVSMGKRQVGSTIKPYLYSLAMENGFTPCDEIDHEPQDLVTETGEVWSPRNTNNLMRGEKVSLRWGLQHSDNWVSAYLMKQLSPYLFKRILLSYGLTEPIDAVVSLCLGPCEVSVEQMVSGYSVFVNGGVCVKPMFVTRIEDKNGSVISTFVPRFHEVISEQASYKMLSMLRSVVDGGTAGGIRKYTMAPMGGKTGTTQNNSDCWFVGFTPSIIGGCWVGGEERSIHFNTMGEGQGARAALPIVGIFLKKVFADTTLGYSQYEQFTIPQQFSDFCVPQR
ncbi:transglycosylase domain-containing protein [Candidatus Azobacteroides pseudotrichonymphae]|uniref:Penicillin-binding protein 1A n=1 Tax=Azobacteroides pseudotrichonymphae genomovar. CFP2 TaxID=511995 RepID=B6YQ58_AZOPC|nr:penicillin-binding protein 1A [Candidatus Azobacteroides pseudotrichonymphae genomovar. CFP2]